MKFEPGDIVTVIDEVRCYYSGYAGRPSQTFKPGDQATIKSIAPNYSGKAGKFYFCIPISFDWSEGLAIEPNNIVLLKTHAQ